MRTCVKNWLKDNGIPYDKIVFTNENKDKRVKELNLDILIEDRVSNVWDVAKVIPVICIATNYNRECLGNNIYRVSSWSLVYNTIREIKK